MSLWNCLEKQLRKITRLKISRIPQSWTKMNVISEFLPCKMRVNMWLMMNDPKTLFTFNIQATKGKSRPHFPCICTPSDSSKPFPKSPENANKVSLSEFLSPLTKENSFFIFCSELKSNQRSLQTDLKGGCLISGSLCSWWDMFEDLATWMGASKGNLFSCDSQFSLFIASKWVSILDEWESHSNLSKAC